jgi:ribosomal protein S18 acetylase RimI-like enzyme
MPAVEIEAGRQKRHKPYTLNRKRGDKWQCSACGHSEESFGKLRNADCPNRVTSALPPALFRNYQPDERDDQGFVVGTWLKCMESELYSEFGRNPDYKAAKPIHTEHQRSLVLRLLARCDVTLAALESDPDVLIGVIVSEQVEAATAAHWLYVKNDFRGLWIGSELLRRAIGDSTANPLLFTARTRKGDLFFRRYGGIYCPSLTR